MLSVPPLPVTFDELGETLAGAAVVQREAGLALLLHAEAGRLHLGEGKAEVLVQVVQLVDEVAHVAPQHLQREDKRTKNVTLVLFWVTEEQSERSHTHTRTLTLVSKRHYFCLNTALCWPVLKVQTNPNQPTAADLLVFC